MKVKFHQNRIEFSTKTGGINCFFFDLIPFKGRGLLFFLQALWKGVTLSCD